VLCCNGFIVFAELFCVLQMHAAAIAAAATTDKRKL
jgi:hypothetical protein